MDIVQVKKFLNDSEELINGWLGNIPAEDIVSVSVNTNSFEGQYDEITTVFYKVAKVRG